MNISLWIFNFKTKCFEMATLGFFVFGGRQWTPYVDKPTAVPDSSFFTVHNSTAQACLDCVRMEAAGGIRGAPKHCWGWAAKVDALHGADPTENPLLDGGDEVLC